MKKFNPFNRQDDDADENVPWLHTPSIYQHILDHIDPENGRLREDGYTLPDEERRYADTRIRWAPGALDGAFGHHAGGNNEQEKAEQIAEHFVRIGENNSQADKIGLYNILVNDDLMGYIDLAIEEIAKTNVSPYPHIHQFMIFLAKDGPDRGPVKFAIAILGAMGSQSEMELVSLLGLHEEFTLFSAVALANMLDDSESAHWQLAQKVDGWGRIHLVERLAATESPDIKDWLLREGYKNSIMYEYLAYTCAVAGDLSGELAEPEVDDDLLDAASDIIEALIMGGPAQDMDDYQDASFVISRYLEHLESGAMGLGHFVTVDVILNYLTDETWEETERADQTWTEESRRSTIETAERILQYPYWTVLVEKGLQSDDNVEFHLADRAARRLGIDTWTVHWQRLQENPLESRLWFPVMERANEENIADILAFAVRELPLEQIATGPSDEIGFGPQFGIHSCLDAILQDLRNYPTLGWPLIAASLKSPVVRNRNMAIRALAEWDRSDWTDDIVQTIDEAYEAETQEAVKERIGKLIQGESLD